MPPRSGKVALPQLAGGHIEVRQANRKIYAEINLKFRITLAHKDGMSLIQLGSGPSPTLLASSTDAICQLRLIITNSQTTFGTTSLTTQTKS